MKRRLASVACGALPMSPPARWLPAVAVALIVAATSPAAADVVVRLSTALEPGRQFMVDTHILYGGIHGSRAELLDRSFLVAGDEKRIAVFAVNPILYGSITAIAMHPAYHAGEGARSDKMPFLLRTVALDPLAPISWRSLLDSGSPLRPGSVGLRAGDVNIHFEWILRHYLPAFDRAGVGEDLHQYLPLLREMAAYAHGRQALANAKTIVETYTLPDREQFAESVERTEARYRLEMDQRLREIERRLSFSQAQRRVAQDWIEHAHEAAYVYREIMADGDRRQVAAHLDNARQPGASSTAAWTSRESGVEYILRIDTSTSDGGNSGYLTELTVDLNSMLDADDDLWYRKRSNPIFLREAGGAWRVQ